MKNFRKIIQMIFFVLSLSLLYLIIKGDIFDVHQFCPYSIVCFGIANLFKRPFFILYPIMIFGILVPLSTVFLGRWFCSYICYFGTLQELLYSLIHFKKVKKITVSQKNDVILKFLKFIVLLLTIIMSTFGFSKFMNFCPQNIIAYFSIISLAGVIFLSFVIFISFFIERFWCRYLCPYAALMILSMKIGEFMKFKRLIVYRNMETCIDCYQCNKNCPMQINVLEDEYVTDKECISCSKCIVVCPKKNTLKKVWR